MASFRQAIRTTDFALSAEIRLDSHSDAASVSDQATQVRDLVDAVQVTDNPGGDVHLSPLAASSILLNAGIDPVMHITCRDRNRIALRSDLLGAAALGVTSILVRRGEKVPDVVKGEIGKVFDWGVRRLISEARSMRSESPFAEPVDFMIGTAATAFKPDREWQPAKVTRKVESGANFIQTQLCFDVDLLRHYVGRLVALKMLEKVDVIVSVAPVPSEETASWLAQNLRAATLPAKIVKRLRQAKDADQEGVRICAELLAECREIPGVSGANVVSLGDMDHVRAAIVESGLARS